MIQFTVMSCFDSCGMLVPRVCDGSALGGRKADIDITDIFKSGGSDHERIGPNKTKLTEMLMVACCQAWHCTDWKFLPPRQEPFGQGRTRAFNSTLKEAKSLLAKGGRELSVQHWKTVTLEEAKSLLAKGGRELSVQHCLTCQEQLC